MGGGGMGWIDLTLYRDKWWAFVNMIINLLVPIKCREFFD
jgi:hypothetical protein